MGDPFTEREYLRLIAENTAATAKEIGRIGALLGFVVGLGLAVLIFG